MQLHWINNLIKYNIVSDNLSEDTLEHNILLD